MNNNGLFIPEGEERLLFFRRRFFQPAGNLKEGKHLLLTVNRENELTEFSEGRAGFNLYRFQGIFQRAHLIAIYCNQTDLVALLAVQLLPSLR